jgi:D-arabinose 1-dehydrogenase-like Zn-dependent alcohol dehydrogenase
MPKMKVMQVSRANGPFELVERDIPKPTRGTVRIKVQACGVCHSDSMVKQGLFPNIQYPRVPGHEIAGVIDELGPEVVGWPADQRVGVGWYGGQVH